MKTARQMTQKDVLSLSANKVINQKAFANGLGIPMGAVVNLLPSEEGEDIARLEQEPVCCHRCGAFVNPFCTLEVQAGKWKCNFCELINDTEQSKSSVNLQTCLEMKSTAVDYMTPLSVPVQTRSELQVVVFVVDLTFSEHQLHLVTQSIKQAVGRMDGNVHVGLVFVDSCVSICNLRGKEGLLDLQCVPGHTINMPASLRRPLGGFGSCLCPLKTCLTNFIFALKAVTTSKPQLQERMRPRCLGTAIHEALMAIKETRKLDQAHARRERVMVMTCGPPNHGPGAVPSKFSNDNPIFNEAKKNSQEYFARLADVALGMDVKIDLYGISFSPIGLSLIEILPKATSGVLSLHSVITPGLFATQISESLHRAFGTHGMVDVRLSRGLRLSKIIGPVSQRMQPGESGRRKLTTNACRLKSMEIGKSLSLFIEATTDFNCDDLYIQVNQVDLRDKCGLWNIGLVELEGLEAWISN